MILSIRFVFLFCVMLGIANISECQTADLIIQKTGSVAVNEGEPMSYTIKISNNGPTDVNNAFFNDTFPAGVTNVLFGSCTAVGGATCPSSGNYSIATFDSVIASTNYTMYHFSGVIPYLPVNSSITFIINLNAPAFHNISSFSNTATVVTPNGITDPDISTNSSTWNTALINTNRNVDISVQVEVDDLDGYDCSSYPKRYNYTVQWINSGTIDVENVTLTDLLYSIYATNSTFIFPWKISYILWKSNLGSSVTSNYLFPNPDTSSLHPIYPNPIPQTINNLIAEVPLFKHGDTISLSYAFTLYKPIFLGCGDDIIWKLGNKARFTIGNNIPVVRDTVTMNDSMSVTSTYMSCTANTNIKNVDIKVIKTVDDIRGYNADSLPKSYNYTIKWINLGPYDVNDIILMDKINAINAIVSNIGTAMYEYTWNISNISWSSSTGTTTPFAGFNSPNIIQMSPMSFFTQTYSMCYLETPVLLFQSGDTITLSYTFTLNKPTISGCGKENLRWDLENVADFRLSSCYADSNANNDNRIIVGPQLATNSPCILTDLKVIKQVDDAIGYACEEFPRTYNYKIKWVNGGSVNIDSVYLRDYFTMPYQFMGSGNAEYTYDWRINNASWHSSSGLSTPVDNFLAYSGSKKIPNCNPVFGCTYDDRITSIYSFIPKFYANDTITLSYNFTIQTPTIAGCGRNITWNLLNQSYISANFNQYLFDTVSANNIQAVNSGVFTATATDLVISTAANPAIVNNGDTLTFTNEFYNASGSDATPASWVDTLPETFHIDTNSIRCIPITGSPPCGTITYDSVTRILRQEIPNLPANSGLKVEFKGVVTSTITVTEYNKANAIYSCLDCVPATNFTQTNYQINGECDTVYAGADGDTSVLLNSNDTIFLFSVLNNQAQAGGTWTRESGTGGVFNANLGILIINPQLTASIFRYILNTSQACSPDTAFIIVHILQSVTHDTFNIHLPINTTDTICNHLHSLTDSVKIISCDSTTSGISTHGIWVILPTTHCLEYHSTAIKGTDSLCLMACDTQLHICKETTFFIHSNGVPPKAIDDCIIRTTINKTVIIDILSNDLKTDNDSIILCDTAIVSQPQHGTASLNQDGTISYTPNTNYIGDDRFQYKICDADGNDTASVCLVITCKEEADCSFVPNAFSPNNDGTNDTFKVRFNCEVSSFYLLIFDRWGNKIYESSNSAKGWDGTYNNSKSQQDVYAYYLEFKPVCSENKIIKKGNILLLEK